MSEVVDLRGVILGARKRWWLILLFVLLGGGAGYGWSGLAQPTYRATASVLVGQSLQAPDLSKQDLEASQQLAHTYADLVRRQPVLSGAAAVLGLDASWQTLLDHVQVDLAPDNGTLIVITVDAGSSAAAASLAGAIADQLVRLSPSEAGRGGAAEIQDFVGNRLATLKTDIRHAQALIDTLEGELALARAERRRESLRLEIEGQQRLVIAWLGNYSSLLGVLSPEQSPNSLAVLEEASAQAEPVRPATILTTALAAVAGLLLALGIVYVLESRARHGWIESNPTGFDPWVGSDGRDARRKSEPVLVMPDARLPDISQRGISPRDDFGSSQPAGRHRRGLAG